MKRAIETLTLACVALSWSAGASGQDVISYIDAKTKKETTTKGSIQEETASQVTYAAGTAGTTREIPALAIRDISYEVPGAVRLTYRSAAGLEKLLADPSAPESKRREDIASAIKGYQEVLAQLSAEKKFAARHLEFKIAELRARQAEDDRQAAPAAIEALTAFMHKHPDSWQITRAAKLLAELQLDQGDAGGAQKTYEELAANPNLAKETRQDCDFSIAQAMIRGGKFSDAERKLQGVLGGVTADDPRAMRARIYLAECTGASQKEKLPDAVAALEDIIRKTADNDIRAVAYNALGDCYRLNGKNKDALYSYLWVDVIFHQNRQEHVKAMEQLARLFEEQGDKLRAREYRDRLKKAGR